MKITLMTGGKDDTYVLPLMSALISQGIEVNFIGNGLMKRAEYINQENVNYYKLYENTDENSLFIYKVIKVLKSYFNIFFYAFQTNSQIFHIQWFIKFPFFDWSILNVYYKILGKKLIYTAHNVNAEARDGNDTSLNRTILKIMYKLLDHIFVHTDKMKSQLIHDFKVNEKKITVIPFGINNVFPQTSITQSESRKKLNLPSNKKILLYFGNIAPYKGLKNLVIAMNTLIKTEKNFLLIISGPIKKHAKAYCEEILHFIDNNNLNDSVLKKIEYIPDEEVELYFKAADVLILPYKYIFQSGVLVLSYNFGLPVISTDVGSLREDVIEGKTGFVCKPEDPDDLAEKITHYFKSELYLNLTKNREWIKVYANEKYSWDKVGKLTYEVYKSFA